MRSPRLPTNSAVSSDVGERRCAPCSQRVMRLDRVPADRHDARLAAFAEHAHRAIAQVDVREVEPDELRQAQAGGIEQLHDRLVAHARAASSVRKLSRRVI